MRRRLALLALAFAALVGISAPAEAANAPAPVSIAPAVSTTAVAPNVSTLITNLPQLAAWEWIG